MKFKEWQGPWREAKVLSGLKPGVLLQETDCVTQAP